MSQVSVRIEGSPSQPPSSSRLIYEGSKAFWRYRCTLDLFIVVHEALGEGEGSAVVCGGVGDGDGEGGGSGRAIIEVIGYHPGKDIETTRLYLDAAAIYENISQQDMKAEIEKKKEVSVRNRRSFLLKNLKKETLEQYAINYVLSRISIQQLIERLPCDVEGKIAGPDTSSPSPFIKIGLNAGYADKVDERNGQLVTLLPAPPSLATIAPYKIPHTRIVPMEEIKKAMEDLNKEQAIFQQAVTVIEKSVEVVEQHLFPSVPETASVSDKAHSPRSKRGPVLRGNSFMRRSIDDNCILENTCSPSLVVAHSSSTDPGDERGEKKLMRHSSHSHGLRLVSWDNPFNAQNEEEEEEEEEGNEQPQLQKRLFSPSKKKRNKKKAQHPRHLPKLHHIPSRCASPPTVISSSTLSLTPIRKREVLPMDKSKPAYARSTISSRLFTGITTTTTFQ